MPVWESHRPGVVRFSNEEPITRGPVLGAVVETSRSPSSYQPSYPTESPNSKILRLETDALAIGSDSNAGVMRRVIHTRTLRGLPSYISL
mmetsp:Transcript_15401/g.19244  ORF Transcript_15401/g.19244 Transcript_15401/m.19244 type:complete len:90 (+) Transcript_15401:179-448(+)